MTVDRPYEEVWMWISNPIKYSILYPNWIKSIIHISANKYHVEDQFGGSYDIDVLLKHDTGVIDLKIGPETSHLQISSLAQSKTSLIHTARRWEGANALVWFFHKRTTDKDFENAKKVIEKK